MTLQNNFKPVRKAVFPVAGLGSRFLPATKVMPKEMLTINDRPLIQHVVEEAKAAGIEEFIFITGRSKEMLVEHFDCQPELEETLRARGKTEMLTRVMDSQMPEGKFFLTRQKKPLGLGHAIWCARELIGDEPFAIILPDDVILNQKSCLHQMMDAYNQHGGNIVAVKNVPQEETYKYGILDIDVDKGDLVSIKGLVEKPDIAKAPSTLSVIGRYILQPEIFTHLAKFESGTGGEIQLTDSMAKMIGHYPFHGLRFKGDHFDSGSRAGFIQANIAYGLADPSISACLRQAILDIAETLKHDHKLKGAA